MTEASAHIYFYIDPKLILQQGFGGKEFLLEKINSYISTITCIKELTNSCVENNEMDNLRYCLSKLKSSVSELSISSFTTNINELIAASDNNEPKTKLEAKLKDFLLICELVLIDLANLKKNEGLLE